MGDRDHIIQSLFESMTAVKRGMAGQLHLSAHDCPLSPAQLELLFAIRHAQPVSFKQLAQLLYLTPGAISQLAEGLEQHGFISRRADPQDRRVQWLQVNKKGHKLLDAVEKRRRSLLELIIADLTDEELAVWLRVQQKLLRRLQTETDTTNKQEQT
ncbi:MAG TPA: MarR family transcriptional regulator [Candidatus Saccharimonadales bacterium]|nr:MarR family transcriptional regulator [Candidatus Saccharimonadales bacterium]